MFHDDVSLALLAGGKGRRLGQVPKGLLELQGEPFLARLARLGTAFADCFLVTSDDAPYRSFGLRSVPDVLPGRGAPGGVHAALCAASTPWVAVVACDMPFVTLAALERLLRERTDEVELLCFEVRSRLEPLLGVYRSALGSRFGAALGEGASFRSLYTHFRARILPEAALAEADPSLRAVVSVNTERDLALAGGRRPAS